LQVLEDERLVAELDWYILPVLNPDGYQFTHEHVILLFSLHSRQKKTLRL
jgi:hypothetical protein